tara:strand:- start:673 stop:1089 length:417 start_codon:yes stop_codon:yes gene_type:complete
MIIDFYGHAKKAIKDDVEAALWFAKDELMPRHRKLSVTVHFVKDLRKKEGVHGDVLDEDDREYTIRVDSSQARIELISTILHEMVHVYQYATRKMTQPSGDIIVYDKTEYAWDMAYKDKPWEIEAHKLERDLYAKFYK